MHLYRFSYSVSKPYPFQWFTPVVIVGGLVLTVLFSFITYPANAYDMKIETSSDPRGFEKDHRPDSPFSWWASEDLEPKCEPFDLSVGTQFFTTNKGFLYTVDKVHQTNPETDEIDDMDQSVPYLNESLRDCRPTKLIIGLTKDDFATPPTRWISWIGNSYFEAHATCTIHNQTDRDSARIDFSMKKSGVAKYEWDYIIKHDSNSSFWWGAQLLNTYWFSLMQLLSQKGYFEKKEFGFYNRGRFTFTYDPERNKTIHDVDFHVLEFYLVSASTDYSLGGLAWEKNPDGSLKDIYNNPKSNVSLAVTEASYFAKVLHSFLVADLANPQIPNMLLDETNLRYFLGSKGNDINRQRGGAFEKDPGADQDLAFLYRLQSPRNRTKLVLLNETWEDFQPDRGDLGTSDATVYKKYACSVARRKSWGKIFVLVLVADLVFLQASWKVLNLVAGLLVERQAPTTAMACKGCLEAKEKGREKPIELQSLMPENEDTASETEVPRRSTAPEYEGTASGAQVPRRTTN